MNGVPRTRRRERPGSTGMESFNQAIVVYPLETHEVGGVTFDLEAIHVSDNPDNLGEFTLVQSGKELENLRVDFESTGTVSEATENGEVTTYTPGDALGVLRALPYQINETTKVTREAAFHNRLDALSLST